MKRLTLVLCSLAALGLILGLGACKKDQPAAPIEEKKESLKAEEKKEAPKAEEKKADPKAEEKKEEAAGAGGKIGVTVCDTYLEKYEQCVSGKVPEAARVQMKVAMDATRLAWKKAAETSAGREGLAKACQIALDAAKKNMAHFKCEW